MPGLDIGHLILLSAVALVVFGPERLLQIGRALGQALSAFRRIGIEPALNTEPLLQWDENDPEAGQLPVVQASWVERLEDLRSHLVRAALPLLVLAGVCFVFSDDLLRLLRAPAGPDFKFVASGPLDGFVLRWKVSLYGGLILSQPFWSYELLACIGPALQRQQRRLLYPIALVFALLFVTGALLAYGQLAPILRGLAAMFGREVAYQPNASQYISFVVFLMLGGGLVVALPISLLLLAWAGLLSAGRLRRHRKVAYFAFFAFAELGLPAADPILAPMLVLVPLVMSFEAGVILVRLLSRAPEQQPAAERPPERPAARPSTY